MQLLGLVSTPVNHFTCYLIESEKRVTFKDPITQRPSKDLGAYRHVGLKIMCLFVERKPFRPIVVFVRPFLVSQRWDFVARRKRGKFKGPFSSISLLTKS